MKALTAAAAGRSVNVIAQALRRDPDLEVRRTAIRAQR
jgi:hypothetical protein